jgi:hypothetical protein
MWAKSAEPRVEEFGITEDDLERAPRLFLRAHRPGLLLTVYLVVIAAVFTAALQAGHSWTAALFFSTILVAACSILLLPAVIVALCLGERVEERWLCRQVPVLRACLAYQRAVDEHRNRMVGSSRRRPSSKNEWGACSPSTLLVEVGWLLEQEVSGDLRRVERAATGADFIVEAPGRKILVRCEPGSTPPTRALARELTTSLADHDATTAWIVTAATPSEEFIDYVADRSISVVAPWRIGKPPGSAVS